MTLSETNFGIKFSSIAGLIGLVVYPLMISMHGYNWWNYVLEMSFGPLFILFNIGLYLFIRKLGDSFFNLVAVTFNILAGAGVLVTNMVQKAVFTIGRDYSKLEDEFSKEIIQRAFQVGNLTQLGLDFYFDILVSVGTAFLALALLKQNYYSKWLIPLGIIIAFGGLLINTLSFPIPPADSQLFDVGPLYAVFMSILLIGMVYYILKNTKNESK